MVQQLQDLGIKEQEFCKRWNASSKKPLSVSTLTEWGRSQNVLRVIAYAKERDMTFNELKTKLKNNEERMDTVLIESEANIRDMTFYVTRHF